jgi:hypothetical protein
MMLLHVALTCFRAVSPYRKTLDDVIIQFRKLFTSRFVQVFHVLDLLSRMPLRLSS